ncbi:B12-binding domain-containing radical SAM protein [Vallitalea okinawensis]|uniref:B12-binding domain-containing radical SAM protein n=1 Tax=Vallitalea okinawensis TaxID=2078660 RepID=UPI001FA8C1ED|nr:B12-binding domain-containing radical SAM protein [Vallitalea okinawensis]
MKECDKMKVLLTAINAKYIHTSLALRYLKRYCKTYTRDLYLKEYTINNSMDYILSELYLEKPDILCLSCYIWNIEMIKELTTEFKKVSPKTMIVFGGPEVSYESKGFMENYKDVDIVIVGEGEATFNKLMEVYIDQKGDLSEVPGIVYRQGETLHVTTKGPAMNMDDIPFPYEDFSEFQNKIIYYETTRGCPFNCQYCLSSTEKGVRYRSFDLVKNELQLFLDHRVMQVKFVDRTFNCSKKHALNIWNYLMNHDNGYTNFHFEISADLLDEETIDILKASRPGLFQFEIGVQSTNLQTIDYIKRKMDFEVLSEKVKKITALENIHQHLDLIAGLPGEDYESFGRSFNDVYALKPEQLQLGFLKVLKGSGLYYDQEKYGLVYRDHAPYEILYTKEVSYDEMLKLKMIEEMVEDYYNSGRFINGITYLVSLFDSPFKCFEELAEFWTEEGYHHLNHSKLAYYDHLVEFYHKKFSDDDQVFICLLLFDLYYHEKAKKLADWMRPLQIADYELSIREFYQDPLLVERYLPDYEELNAKQLSRKAHVEVFPINVLAWLKDGKIQKRLTAVLFDYSSKNPIINKAKLSDVTAHIIKVEDRS